MLTVAMVGMGWHSWLFREEMRALLGDISILHPRIVSYDIGQEEISKLSGAALLEEVLILGGHSMFPESPDLQNSLCRTIGEWAIQNFEEGDFAVRTRKIGELPDTISGRSFEDKVGRVVSSNGIRVNLESPSNEIVIIIAGSNDGDTHPEPFEFGETMVVWGLRVKDWSKESFSGRSPTERPYFKPISLEPRQARLLISLSRVPGREIKAVVDPFCGTGGIAIEAVLQDIRALASDLDSRMVEGTKENLRWLGKECVVKKWDASDLSTLWGEREGCSFVFDPPYGRSSWRSVDSLDIFLSVLKEAKKIDVEGVVSTMLPAGPEALNSGNNDDIIVMGKKWSELMSIIQEIGWSVHLFCPVRVHRSLVRAIVVCHPAD